LSQWQRGDLPTELNTLVRYWTLTAPISRRFTCVGARNRLGFALQLCALRYPGRLLGPGELIPAEALRFLAHQVDTTPEALAAYTARFQTRPPDPGGSAAIYSS
jgi:hypothetical protein